MIDVLALGGIPLHDSFPRDPVQDLRGMSVGRQTIPDRFQVEEGVSIIVRIPMLVD
jgi:hypothetical protein